MADQLIVTSLAERPDLVEATWELSYLWPTFMKHDPVGDLYYTRCVDQFPDLAIVAEDPLAPGIVQARGFAVPFAARGHDLPDDGWDAVVRWGIEDVVDRRPSTHVSALEIAIRPNHRGAGLAARMIEAFRQGAIGRGAQHLVAPVRPSEKHLEPLESIADYAGRTRADGLPTDPWLRTHVRVGGVIDRIAPRSMTIVGSLAEWQEWTGSRFESSGPHVVDHALVPVIADIDRDVAVYVEPNVWVRHSLESG